MEKDYILPKNYTDEEFDKFIESKQKQSKIKSQPAKPEESEKDSSLMNALEAYGTGARSFFDTAFLGASDPIVSSASAVVGNLISSGFDAEDAVDFVKKSTDWKRLKKEYQEDVELRKKLKKKHDIASSVGSLAGGLSTIGPAGAIAKNVTKAVDLIPKLKVAKEAPGILGGLAKTGGAAAEGALILPGIEVPTELIHQATGFGEQKPISSGDIAQKSAIGAGVMGGIKGSIETGKLLGKRGMMVAAPLAIGGYLMYPETENKEPQTPVSEEDLSKKIEAEEKWQNVKKLLK